MILSLFGFLVVVSLALIIIGLTKPTESAQALVGFFLLFLLGLIIVNGTLEYEVGSNVTTNYTYAGDGSVTSTDQEILYTYDFFDDTTSHRVGYYLSIAAAIGFIGVIFAIAKTNWRKDV